MSAHTFDEYRANLIEQLVASIDDAAARSALQRSLTAQVDAAIAAQNNQRRFADLKPSSPAVATALQKMAIRARQQDEEVSP